MCRGGDMWRGDGERVKLGLFRQWLIKRQLSHSPLVGWVVLPIGGTTKRQAEKKRNNESYWKWHDSTRNTMLNIMTSRSKESLLHSSLRKKEKHEGSEQKWLENTTTLPPSSLPTQPQRLFIFILHLLATDKQRQHNESYCFDSLA